MIAKGTTGTKPLQCPPVLSSGFKENKHQNSASKSLCVSALVFLTVPINYIKIFYPENRKLKVYI